MKPEFNLPESIAQLKETHARSIAIKLDQFGRPLWILNRITEPGQAELHELATDLTQILEGTGTMVRGGDMVRKQLHSLHEWRGDLLKGGNRIALTRGDIIVTDAGTPHQTIPEQDVPLIFLTFKHFLKEYLISGKINEKVRQKILGIKGLIMDVDGTQTDGFLFLNKDGEEFARFSRLDGLGLDWMRNNGFYLGMISKEQVSIVAARAKKVKADCLFGINDKITAAEKMISNWGISLAEIAFVGDDVNDVNLLKTVGFSACPADSSTEVLSTVDYILPAKRGQHVIRILAELILSAQGKPLS